MSEQVTDEDRETAWKSVCGHHRNSPDAVPVVDHFVPFFAAHRLAAERRGAAAERKYWTGVIESRLSAAKRFGLGPQAFVLETLLGELETRGGK